ncbi:MAG: hypothetical protein ACPF9F_00330 [Acholeplasmataceae bacterium]
MFKWLFKNLILPLLILLAIPVTLIALIYKPMDNPLASLEETEQISVLTRIDASVEAFLADETGELPVTISMSEDEINALLLSVLQDQNREYLNSASYVFEEQLFGYAGSWVELEDDVLSVISKADIFIPLGEDSFTYQTALTLSFSIDINLDTITLEFESLKLGNLGLLWIYNIANSAMEAIAEVNIENTINDLFEGYGTFDSENLSVVIDVKDLLLTLVGADEATSELFEQAMVFIASAELVDVGPVEDAFELNVHLEKLRLEEPIESFDPALIPAGATEFQAIFSELFDPYVIMGSIIESSLNTDTVLPYVDLSETRLNQIVGYVLSSSIVDGMLYQLDVSGYHIHIDVPVIQMNDAMSIIVPIQVENEGQMFETAIIINVSPELSESDLLFQFTSIQLGTIVIDETLIESGLAFVSSDFIDGNSIKIKSIDTLFGVEGVSLETVRVVGDALRVSVNASEALDTTVIAETVNDVLDTLSTDENIPESVSVAAEEVINAALSGDEAAVTEAVDTLIETFDTLTEEEQTALSETVLSIIETSDLSLDEIFGLLPE